MVRKPIFHVSKHNAESFSQYGKGGVPRGGAGKGNMGGQGEKMKAAACKFGDENFNFCSREKWEKKSSSNLVSGLRLLRDTQKVQMERPLLSPGEEKMLISTKTAQKLRINLGYIYQQHLG